MERKLTNFVESFVQYAQPFNAPDRYLKWGAVFLVAALLGRRVGVPMRGGILCPNLYIQMVGGPSVGKSQTCKAITSIMQPASDISLIPESLTRAAMEDYMADTIKFRKSPEGTMINSCEFVGISDELQGILPDQDIGHLTLYNRLFDLPKFYTAQTRSNGEVRLEYPYCGLFTGTQPQFLALTMPEAAWGMGFMSRTVMVFGTAKQRTSAFKSQSLNMGLQKDLIADAKTIFSLYGHFKWTKEAIALYERWWVDAGGKPIPTAKRLVMGYNGRREINLLKVAMAISVAKSNTLVVDEPDVADALTMLIEAESYMPHIFNEMAASGSMMAIEDIIDLVRTNAANNRDTTEAALIETLMQRFPATQVASIIENLITSKAIKNVGGIDAKGLRKFRPGDDIPQV